ncbi:MAG: transferrin receptor-like dimerization domain-containing protein [Pseudomonadota bacterium]|jgi:N-acetylated-alpha-linked acidic dipeptidase
MSLRPVLAVAVSTAALAMAVAAQAADKSAPLLGFSAEGAAKERSLEQSFDQALSAEAMRQRLEFMAAEPNHVGSAHDKLLAEWSLAQFKSWGWDAHIETFEVLYPTPLAESLELVGPTPFKAALHETEVAGDRTSGKTKDALPPYVAYQGDGDVTAGLVYVNYGMPDDYKALERQGVSVKGKIVIARYGAGWRGLKPQLAQEHGAVGCIIYSDPADDGYATDEVWPKGAERPPQGVQRGSVQKMMIYPGDPLTPGVAATKDAKRLTRETAETILKIPALPISYADARPFLEAMDGPIAPKNFRGALPITYHLGGGDTGPKAHLLVKSDWSLKTIYDVVAVLKGSQYPDQWVLRGNHHDGWVFGATDPLSGQVALMEEAKAIGVLAKTGWRPKRTLVYLSWDAEEPGLIGSTEWAEAHAEELSKKAVLYLNSDVNLRGLFDAEGSHSLQALVNGATADVKDPETGVSVSDRLRGVVQVEAAAPNARPELKAAAKAAASGGELLLGALGSGSDYTAFIGHLGVASLNLGFGGEGQEGGVYHSIYDSYDHFIRYGDPKLEYEVALAQVAGRVMLRAADAEAPPLRFTSFAETVERYVADLKHLREQMKEREETDAKLRSAKAYELASDPLHPTYAPKPEAPVQAVDFTPLDKSVTRLKASAAAFDKAFADKAGVLSKAQTKALQGLMLGAERDLLLEGGLPGRPWFRHAIYAPGMLTGYAPKTVPGVREAIESRRWSEADAYAVKTAAALDAYAARLDKGTALIIASK